MPEFLSIFANSEIEKHLSRHLSRPKDPNTDGGTTTKRTCKSCWKGGTQSTLMVKFINERLPESKLTVHWLLSMTWPEMILLSVGTSLAFILFFAALFHLLDGYDDAQEAFAVSTQTFLTIGYGSLAPKTMWGHTIVYLETFSSVIVLSIVTGIPYIKFSKSVAKLVIAQPVINMGDQGPQLQIRFCMDTQHAHLTDVKFKLTLARTERSATGMV